MFIAAVRQGRIEPIWKAPGLLHIEFDNATVERFHNHGWFRPDGAEESYFVEVRLMPRVPLLRGFADR